MGLPGQVMERLFKSTQLENDLQQEESINNKWPFLTRVSYILRGVERTLFFISWGNMQVKSSIIEKDSKSEYVIANAHK